MIKRQPPNFIFIDIDRCLFATDKEFWKAIDDTCKNIEQILRGKPTVLWSGNGIHICQPIEAMILEQESKFAQFDQPSQLNSYPIINRTQITILHSNPVCFEFQVLIIPNMTSKIEK